MRVLHARAGECRIGLSLGAAACSLPGYTVHMCVVQSARLGAMRGAAWCSLFIIVENDKGVQHGQFPSLHPVWTSLVGITTTSGCLTRSRFRHQISLIPEFTAVLLLISAERNQGTESRRQPQDNRSSGRDTRTCYTSTYLYVARLVFILPCGVLRTPVEGGSQGRENVFRVKTERNGACQRKPEIGQDSAMRSQRPRRWHDPPFNSPSSLRGRLPTSLNAPLAALRPPRDKERCLRTFVRTGARFSSVITKRASEGVVSAV
ncbi:uncharacterized protein F5Z01DRAFT_549814 [Emericellopsis atlantica]|uniref:Uncharacterized protein n=1 Tax=Emericellopsis atlantica TaxID=2614577 RepID=A0A9P7ZPR8_9HYPO|nr:uncharacterized protein F5Z01DRAFT_549814 [Emericellopsis atlantica]KAG9255607.1 hypothetical protein F5Z01DRAFT_549814 [Emericellopsis atlantica]